jgi:hypothetical protein
MNEKSFQIAYLNTFYSPLSLPEKGWTRFIKKLCSSDKMYVKQGEESENVYIAQQVFEVLAQMQIDTDREDPFNGSALLDEDEKYLCVLNSKVTEIVNTLQFKIGMNKLSTTMIDLGMKLDTGSFLIKHEHKSKIFWKFSKAAFVKFGGV